MNAALSAVIFNDGESLLAAKHSTIWLLSADEKLDYPDLATVLPVAYFLGKVVTKLCAAYADQITASQHQGRPAFYTQVRMF